MSVFLSVIIGLSVLSVYRGVTLGRSTSTALAKRRVAVLLAEAGWQRISVSLFVSASILVGFCGLALCAAFFGRFGLVYPLGALAGLLPAGIAKNRRQIRRRTFRAEWPDAIASLVSAIRAGMSLPEACTSLASRGPLHLRDGFSSFASSYRATGSLETGLARLREDLADPVADRVVVALLLAHEVGGTDLIRILKAIGNFVRDDLRTRKEIEARWSWTVTAARVAAAAPWVILALMATRPEAANAYNTTTGMIVLGVGALATVLGYRLMLRAGRLPDEPRLQL
jgi:tight adherence protein B